MPGTQDAHSESEISEIPKVSEILIFQQSKKNQSQFTMQRVKSGNTDR